MDKPESVDAYLATAPAHWQPILESLRELLLQTELEETIKWMFPMYTLDGKHVIGMIHTKGYAGLWFNQGALLSDPAQLLVNASPEKTVAQRQLRFSSEAELNLELAAAYIQEAIENQQMGLEIKASPKAEIVVPPLLQQALDQDPALAAAFATFTPYKQREFCEHISSAKREVTKQSRLEKDTPMILRGEGLSDKYRK